MFSNILKVEILQQKRSLYETLTPLLFFVLCVVLFSFSFSSDVGLVKKTAPAILLVLSLLVSILSLSNLFVIDYKDGSLEQIVLHPKILTIISAKLIAQFISYYLPLILMTPILGFMLYLSAKTICILLLLELLLCPILLLLGAMVQALVLRAKNGTMFLAVLILPLYIPGLLFTLGAIENFINNSFNFAPVYLLLAILVLSLFFAPLVIAVGLKLSVD